MNPIKSKLRKVLTKNKSRKNVALLNPSSEFNAKTKMKVKGKKRRKIPTADILCKIEESPATGS